MRPVLLILLMAAWGLAHAQSVPSSAVLQKCLLAADDMTWGRLHLSADQLERMRRVQHACREECEGAGVKKVDNPISNADGSTVMSEVKNILTADQYRVWVAQCGSGPSGPPK